MPALHDQPYPSHPVAQLPWLVATLRRERRRLRDMLAAIPDADAASLATWDALQTRVRDLRDMARTLEGMRRPQA